MKTTEEKYLKILQDLHNLLKYTNRVSMNDFCQKNNVSKGIPQIMQQGGIIKCTKRGPQSEWTWNSIPPNIQMVREIVRKLGEKNPPRKTRVNESITPKQTRIMNSDRVNISNKFDKNTIRISILWGFFTFNRN